jgi:hypothetical protein
MYAFKNVTLILIRFKVLFRFMLQFVTFSKNYFRYSVCRGQRDCSAVMYWQEKMFRLYLAIGH